MQNTKGVSQGAEGQEGKKMKKIEKKIMLEGQEVTLETGRLAKQADGAVLASCGNNVVLVTVVSSTRESTMDFFPLMVEYSEKFYSTGKIPGGYFKREGRPTGEAILNARLIDRPLRPCFPDAYKQDTQVVATILSYDGKYPVNSLASIAASAAFHISDVPFGGPICSLQIARIDGKFVANPAVADLENADMDIFMAATRNGILMVEGEAKFCSEADVLAALKYGHEAMQPFFDAQDALRTETGSKAKA